MTVTPTPPAPPQLSPDGRWWWTGHEWVTAEATPTPLASIDPTLSTPLLASDLEPSVRARRSWLRPWPIAGGVAVFGVVIAIVVATSSTSGGHSAPVPFKQTAQVAGLDVTVVSVVCGTSDPVGCSFVVGFTNVSAAPRQIRMSDVTLTDASGRSYTADPNGTDDVLVPYLTVQPGETAGFDRIGVHGLLFSFDMTTTAVADHLVIMEKTFTVPHKGPSTGS